MPASTRDPKPTATRRPGRSPGRVTIVATIAIAAPIRPERLPAPAAPPSTMTSEIV